MPKPVRGVVKGNVVVPEEPFVLPEGAEVVISLPPGLCLLKHAGVWRDLENLDNLVAQIYGNRTAREQPVSKCTC